jgi:hypothetical protein
MSNIVPVKQAPLAGLAGYGGGVPGLYFLGADGTSVSITKSLRFNNAHKSYLKRTPSSTGNRRTFTFSCWVKRSTIGSSLMRRFFAAGATSVSTNNVTLAFYQDTLFFQIGTSSNRITSSQVFRDTSAWYHIVLAVDTTQATASNRVKIYVNGSQITDFGTAGYPSQNTDTAVNNTEQHIVGAGVDSGGAVPDGPFDGYMADCHLVDGSQLDPTSFGAFNSDGVWHAAKFSGSYGTNGYHLFDFESESTVGHDSSGNNNDFTAYNILAATGQYIDDITGTQRSGFPWSQMFDGRLNHGAVPNPGSSFTFSPSPTIPFTTLQIYAYKDSSPGTLKINGTDITSQVPNHNGIGPNQLTTITGISSPLTSIQSISNGSLANIVFAGLVIDGALLLDTAAEVDILFDVPANGDSSDDTGAGAQVSGNYAVLNVLEDAAAGGNAALSNGNLQIDGTSSEQFRAATIPVSSGKWYFEIVQREGTDFGPGVWAYPLASPSSQFYQNTNYRYNSNGGVYNQSGLVASYSSFAVGDVIGTALDLDNGKVYFSKNGTWQNSGNPATQTNPAATGLTGQWVFGASTNGNGTILNANFGQRAFAYNAPSGFKALCTTNLPDPTIADGSDYFDVVTYTGNGSTKTVSGLSFSPDWIWFKERSAIREHHLYDTVRGVQKAIYSDATLAEGSDTDALSSFNSDGWTMGADGGSNANNETYVAWCWDAGSSTATNNDGSITSYVRASQTSGVSIVTFTGTGGNATVGHGLNAEPHVLLTKCRESGFNWAVYFKEKGNNGRFMLNNTLAFASNSSFWNNTTPTSSVFSIGSFFANGNTFVAYCMTPIAGFSSFGKYTGNGNADGPFVNTGMRPKYIMVRGDYQGGDWLIVDTERNVGKHNVSTGSLAANAAQLESYFGANNLDILSNGFKMRTTNAVYNTSGTTYYYMAFAENPFQSNGGLAR